MNITNQLAGEINNCIIFIIFADLLNVEIIFRGVINFPDNEAYIDIIFSKRIQFEFVFELK